MANNEKEIAECNNCSMQQRECYCDWSDYYYKEVIEVI